LWINGVMIGVLLALCAVALALEARAPPDCSLNGEINATTGACVCEGPWTGADCGVLMVQPVAPDTGYGQLPNRSSTWGGNAVLFGYGELVASRPYLSFFLVLLWTSLLFIILPTYTHTSHLCFL